jgi:hypothetical protein
VIVAPVVVCFRHEELVRRVRQQTIEAIGKTDA